ncbi:hypothetical protein HF1_08470 [Mycoplasma haemofelis str. Langford 1]|uniref:Uncharacterized protein n=2 Tax=Mycoplasma haemofelis TaxID=29501 RepID=F6FIY6_MYCHI|nr:hypothetical protein [Mycoplasma haemofelis]AEG73184.1 hypothetical protein MHF_0927 [Mycoplasma haemofelis Ohio2]CBY92855.1 hypothetical protein HF1_08470 [Mycoplasma haemofelis str. Langford 1]
MGNPALAKAGIAALSAGCVGTGGYCIYKFHDSHGNHMELTTSISDLFKTSQNKVLLTNSSTSEEWNSAWVGYRDANKGKDSDEWKISGFSSKSAEDNAFQEFKDACISRYSIKVKGIEDRSYQQVKDWCTRAKKIAELLSDEEGIELIPENQADQDWKTSWNTYREAHKESSGTNYKETDTWTVTNWSQDKANDTLSTNFKSKCLEQSKKDIVNGKEDDLYKQVKNWCTRKKSPLQRG